jgi:hypothetical protein
MCVILHVPLERGKEVEVNLSENDLPGPMELTAKVIWSLALGTSRFRTGLRFCRPLTYGEFHQYTEAQAP